MNDATTFVGIENVNQERFVPLRCLMQGQLNAALGRRDQAIQVRRSLHFSVSSLYSEQKNRNSLLICNAEVISICSVTDEQ